MSMDEQVARLEKQVEFLANRIGMLEDAQDIRHLQHKYGYYMDKAFYEAIIDLFSDDCEIHFLAGIFRGKAGARRLFIDRFRARFARGADGPKSGILMEHPQLQDIIDVAPDRATAKARFRYFMQAGTHYTTGTAYQWWEGGLYENIYIKDNGIWKIQVLIPKMVYIGEYEHGWAYTRPQFVPFLSETFPTDPLGPDELCPEERVLWPETDVLPFHYPHPVTGAQVGPSSP
jgi:hypothetical protein